MEYVRPNYDAANANFAQQPTYVVPEYNEVNFSFNQSAIRNLRIGAAIITNIHLGNTPCTVFLGSTQLFG